MNFKEYWYIVKDWSRVFITCYKYETVRRVADLVDTPDGPLIQEISRLLGKALVEKLELHVSVSGFENLDNLTHYCVASTHASYLDWFVILAYFPTPVRFVARKEITKFPVIGEYLKDQAVLIDRSRGKEAIEKLEAAVDRSLAKDDRYPILIFPEGTRSPDGKIRRFKKGGLSVLISKGLKVVPLVLKGTYDILPRNAYYCQKKVPIRMAICPPVDPQIYGNPDDAIQEVERRIRTTFDKL
ncbi:MAG: 1-acyl-sn-glycerol-3-phosphate acyltransferase [Deltaproteobacteria bacterium]|nr:1-acyl-sn-glycerol-3-phosphate acyltransferase [Deltaproteobacteria bacterium]